MYKYSKSLVGHGNDVRDLTNYNDEIISCSRDGTVKRWKHQNNVDIPSTILNSSSGSFINSITSVGNGLIASAGKDCIIFINSIDDVDADVGTISNLVGHLNNICSLHTYKHLLISSSWDGTAKIWDLNRFELISTLNNEGMSVLNAIILSENKYLTCLADKLIKLWENNKVVKIFKGHNDVVRKLLPINDNLFASSANDGTIKIWDINSGNVVHELIGHESFIYDLIILPNGNLVSSGEDRSIRIWSLTSFKIIQAITLPSISNWCLSNINNDIVVGTSDNNIYVFTNDEAKIANDEDLSVFENAVKNASIAEQSVNINKTDVPDYSRLNQPGNEGQTIMVKNNVGTIEAHQWSNNQWNKIGDVVSSSSSSAKKQYNGKQYDYVFDVDIEDGKPPLKLPFNATDNVYSVAEKFLADNDLPSTYTQEVVNFIQKNTEGHQLTEATAPSSGVTQDVGQNTTNKSNGKKTLAILPVTDYITFKDVNNDQLCKGLTKFNHLNGDKLTIIPSNFKVNSRESLDIINSTVKEVFEWDESSYLIGFDLLRGLITNLGISDIVQDEQLPELILSFINKGLRSENPSLLMMLLKFLSNLINSILFMQIYLTEENQITQFSTILTSLLSQLKDKLDAVDDKHKHYNQFLINLSTFIYNLSVLQIKQKIKNIELAIFFNNNDNNLVKNNESLYRLAISYGNLKTIDLSLPEWKFTVPNESRFDSLMEELNLL